MSIGLASTGKWRVGNWPDQRARMSILEHVAGSFLCRGELKSSYSGELTLARSQTITQPLSYPTLFIGMRDKIGRTKASKLIGQAKDSKIAEGKKKISSNLKAITHQLPQADWWPSQSLRNGQLGREIPHLLLALPQLLLLNMLLYGIGYPFGQFRFAVLLCPFPTISLFLSGAGKHKLWHCSNIG